MPLIASGMIGSRQGWVEAPYCKCPAGFHAIAAALTSVPGTRLFIVPGLICHGVDEVPDVMRGEETQVFGALPEQIGARQVLVLPGTHSKWVIAGPERRRDLRHLHDRRAIRGVARAQHPRPACRRRRPTTPRSIAECGTACARMRR